MGSMNGLLRRASVPVLLSALVVVAALLGSLGTSELDYVVVTGLVNLVMVVGLYVFVGNTGVFSFGHVGFVAIGAYVTSLLVIPAETKKVLFTSMPGVIADAHLGTLPATLAGGVAAGLVALVLSFALMRLSGLTAALGTFAVLLIINVVAVNWSAVTNGAAGVSAIPVTTDQAAGMAWAVVAILLAFAFQQSRFGLRVRAAREDEVAARASGVAIARERGIAFVASAFLLGVGGGLYAQLLGTITPDAFYLSLTFLTLAMLVVGGMTSLSGAVVGVLVITTLGELLRRAETGIGQPGIREVGLALAMLAILILRPQGLMGGRELVLGRLGRRRDGGGGAAERPGSQDSEDGEPLALRGPAADSA
jgi:branched-chain amino acid transport system permease protein